MCWWPRLALNRVFEDLSPRLVDIDQDGRDGVIVIEADALRGASGKFEELADVMRLPARVQRITALPDAPGTACALLADGTWQRVKLKDGP